MTFGRSSCVRDYRTVLIGDREGLHGSAAGAAVPWVHVKRPEGRLASARLYLSRGGDFCDRRLRCWGGISRCVSSAGSRYRRRCCGHVRQSRSFAELVELHLLVGGGAGRNRWRFDRLTLQARTRRLDAGSVDYATPFAPVLALPVGCDDLGRV